MLFIFIIIQTFIVRTYIVQAFQMPAGSMVPTMLVGDHILTNKFIYYFAEPKRGDIVIFPHPQEPDRLFIKRVIAIGGDNIAIKKKEVYINGQKISETYTANLDTAIFPKNESPRDYYGPEIIPEDSIFVLGDNRDQSYDSRFWGFVKKEAIKAKAINIYWSWDKDHDSVRWDRIGNLIK